MTKIKKKKSEPKQAPKMWLLLTIIIALSCALVWGITKAIEPAKPKEDKTTQTKKTKKEDKGSGENVDIKGTDVEQTETSEPEQVEDTQTVEDKVVSGLETPDKTASELDTNTVKSVIDIAFTAIQGSTTNDEEATDNYLKPRYDHHTQGTDMTMLRNIHALFIVGYQYDSGRTQVYYSNSNNVLQFTAVLTHPERGEVAFAGNYVVGTQQLEILTFEGDVSALAFQ